jgi:hypothetical protein
MPISNSGEQPEHPAERTDRAVVVAVRFDDLLVRVAAAGETVHAQQQRLNTAQHGVEEHALSTAMACADGGSGPVRSEIDRRVEKGTAFGVVGNVRRSRGR